MSPGIAHLFRCMLPICISFEKCLFRSFANCTWLIGVFLFLLSGARSFLLCVLTRIRPWWAALALALVRQAALCWCLRASPGEKLGIFIDLLSFGLSSFIKTCSVCSFTFGLSSIFLFICGTYVYILDVDPLLDIYLKYLFLCGLPCYSLNGVFYEQKPLILI